MSAGASGSANAATSLALGGSGGSGGGSLDVTVIAPTWITTYRDQSAGIIAQSIGGKWRQWGNALAASYSWGAKDEVSIGDATAFGGSGGSGQNAGSVTVVAGNVFAYGTFSPAVLAQSIGGSGGNGGTSMSVTASGLSSDPEYKTSGYTGAIAVGGSGSPAVMQARSP